MSTLIRLKALGNPITEHWVCQNDEKSEKTTGEILVRDMYMHQSFAKQNLSR